MSFKGNIVTLAKLDSPDDQKKLIFETLGDLDQYELLGEECLIALYAESNVLSRVKDVTGKTVELISTENRATESRYQGKAALLVKIGPTAFRYHNNGQPYEGLAPKVGDWVVVMSSDGREIFLRDSATKEFACCKRVHWSCIFMRVADPRCVH